MSRIGINLSRRWNLCLILNNKKMREIKSLSEITDKLTLLDVYSNNCGSCQKIKPLIGAFEELHPEVDYCRADIKDFIDPETKKLNEEIMQYTTEKGMTPSFAFLENKKPYIIFHGASTIKEIENRMNRVITDQACPHEKRVKELEEEVKFLRELLLKK
jgi:thiol-disulfide isomerase/thioredoxin